MKYQTVQVNFELNVNELVGLLLHNYRYTPLAELPTFSRVGEIRTVVRDALLNYGVGDHIGYWSDHCSESESPKRVAWAENLVTRAYPNLGK